MKIIDFEIDEYLIKQNQLELSDMIRVAFYRENPILFEMLDYSNDFLFLEPTLFHYFSVEKKLYNSVTLNQSTYGYMEVEKRPKKIKIRSDIHGMVNLPNIGYFKLEPKVEATLHTVENNFAILENGSSSYIKLPIIKNIFLESSKIRLCAHSTDLLSEKFNTSFVETVEQTAEKYKKTLDSTISILKKNVPDLSDLIFKTSRELVVFKSPFQYSMAALTYFGVGFINVVNDFRTEAFFVDDIAHQCGHVIYHALTLHSEVYLKVNKETPLREFTLIKGESRTIYGAFHGLFTYTTIIFTLDKCIENDVFAEEEKWEALGRLGFYMDKFNKDLQHINDNRILTDSGFKFYNMFLSGYHIINNKYDSFLKNSDYTDQPYLFQFDTFKAKNIFF